MRHPQAELTYECLATMLAGCHKQVPQDRALAGARARARVESAARAP